MRRQDCLAICFYKVMCSYGLLNNSDLSLIHDILKCVVFFFFFAWKIVHGICACVYFCVCVHVCVWVHVGAQIDVKFPPGSFSPLDWNRCIADCRAYCFGSSSQLAAGICLCFPCAEIIGGTPCTLIFTWFQGIHTLVLTCAARTLLPNHLASPQMHICNSHLMYLVVNVYGLINLDILSLFMSY